MNSKEEAIMSRRQPLTIKISTFCEILQIGRTKAYELINEGAVSTVRIGRCRLIKYESVENLLKLHSTDEGEA